MVSVNRVSVNRRGPEEDIDRLIDSVISRYGRLDVLVNNEAKGGGKESETEEYDEYISHVFISNNS